MEIRPAADDGFGAGFGQDIGVSRIAVRGAGEADHPHAGGFGSGDPVNRILDHESACRLDAERRRCMDEYVGSGFRLC